MAVQPVTLMDCSVRVVRSALRSRMVRVGNTSVGQAITFGFAAP
jgi:hypothetical protein